MRLHLIKRNDLQNAVEVLVEFHYGCLVATTVAVVRRGEYSHEVLIVVPRVTINDELMSSTDEREFIGVIELGGNVLAENVAGATRRYSPACSLIRIGPQQIAHWPIV